MHLSLNISSMKFWKVAGELYNPKNMAVGSNALSSVINAAFHSSPFFMQIFGYLYQMSNLKKIMAFLILSISVWRLEIGYQFLTMYLFNSL